MNHTLRGLVIALSILFLSACASPPSAPPSPLHPMPTAASDTFPQPSQLRPQVEFWRNVYAVWGLGQVALHDAEHLGLVYAVVELPGPVDDRYSPAQRAFARERAEVLGTELRRLEIKRRDGLPLNAREQALAARIEASAGPRAVFGASERVRAQRGLRERFRRGVEISGRYDGLFRAIFRRAGLPEDLAYLPHVESSFQAHARSSAGAVGLWQFTLPAARIYMDIHPAVDPRLDPVAAARGAARYLRHAYEVLGDWPLAVTSYNHGIGGMRRAKGQFGTDFARIVREYEHPAFGFASRNFYAEFLAAREVAREPGRYFPEGIRYETPLDWDRVVLERHTPAPALAARYRVELGRLAAMNAAWTPSARRGKVALPAGTEVWLPPGTLLGSAQAGPLPGQDLALAAESGSAQRRQ